MAGMGGEAGVESRHAWRDVINTETVLGRGVLALLAAVVKHERDRPRERTGAGIRAAKRRGRHVGRPSTLTSDKLDLAHRLLAEGKGKAAVARMVGIHPATLRRALNGLTVSGAVWHGQSVRPLCGPEKRFSVRRYFQLSSLPGNLSLRSLRARQASYSPFCHPFEISVKPPLSCITFPLLPPACVGCCELQFGQRS